MSSTPTISIRLISPAEFDAVLPALAELLVSTVNGGYTMGFQAPLTYPRARDYWMSLGADLRSGSRLLYVAGSEDRIVGSGQLVLSPWSSLKHWAELQKVFVAPSFRERGFGRSLVATLHAAARVRRCSLLVLSTRYGEPAEALYKKMGYREVDVRGWTACPTTQRYALVTLYKELSL